MQETVMSWILQGGTVGIPKRLFGMMEPLGLSLEDVGALAYLFYLEGNVLSHDVQGQKAVRQLVKKNIVDYHPEDGSFTFVPLIEQIFGILSFEAANDGAQQSLPQRVAELIKRFEKEDGKFLSEREKSSLTHVMQQYAWPTELIIVMYRFYLNERLHKRYDFQFFAKMAYDSGVEDEASFLAYSEKLNYSYQKVKEVLKRLGKFNQPSEAQKAYYEKWQHDWGFSHEIILFAADQTVNADNPNIGYLDKILEDWHKAGAHTEKEIQKLIAERKNVATRKRSDGKRVVRNRVFESGKSRNLNQLEE